MAYTIEFEPLGRRGECQDTDSILTCAHQLGIDIVSICAGKGTCRACKLRVRKGTVSKPTTIEREVFSTQEFKDGWRLACQTYPQSDVKVSVPTESMTTPQRTQVEGLEITVQLEPSVKAYPIKLTAPSLDNPEADADQLLQTLSQQCPGCNQVDIGVLRGLSPRLRDWKWECQTTARDNEVIAVGPRSDRQLGLAVDLGTTKIAGYLIDLKSGQALAAEGAMNPQISHGEDIISRITGAVKSEAEAAQLQKLVADAITELATCLCTEVNASTEEIVEAVVVGNTAMHHLFLGLPVWQLASSPFVAAINAAVDIKSRDLGIPIAPGAYVHLLPNIAGFVGADHVSMLLATKPQWTAGAQLAIDIGTNTEVSLIAGDKITCASCASGPAFEGGHIKDGMRAASGAIERLRIEEDGEIEYQTIEGVPPVGICGSGILDALAQFYQHGIIDRCGRMQDDHPQVRTRRKQREFVLVSKQERNGRPPIVITQQDIRELQLAKAAIQTGVQVLLKANNLGEDDLNQVIIAGAFGSYIDVASAVAIGMLPSLPLGRFRQVGNAAGMGAKLALVSLSKRTEAQNIAAQAEYIELSTDPHFTESFINASYLGNTNPSGKSEV